MENTKQNTSPTRYPSGFEKSIGSVPMASIAKQAPTDFKCFLFFNVIPLWHKQKLGLN